MNEKKIFVFAGWFAEPKLIGTVFEQNNGRGKAVISFEYDLDWLVNNPEFMPDPDILPFPGRQYLPLHKSNFGFLSDASPDRWGRDLIRRRRQMQEKENAVGNDRKSGSEFLTETDFLLGVHDAGRVGGLRFKTDMDGGFVSSDESVAVPPWVTLRKLQNAAWEYEKKQNPALYIWLKQIFAPGSSLGGARPKATVQDEMGNLWIAKFPSRKDEYNVGAWEKVVQDLAGECGLHVPESRLENFTESGYSTFLVKRFDRRDGGRQRVHFASAMTMLGKTDGDNDSSYLDILKVIRTNGSKPEKDIKELWTRIAFNVLISNTDDHLRNHGFLLEKNGWRLSPLYDINPNPFGTNLSLNVTEDDNSKDMNLVLQTAPYYGLTDAEAKEIVDRLQTVVHNRWRSIAEKYKISRAEQEEMQGAFKC